MMKHPKYFILIGLVLMVGALVAVLYVWNTVQTVLSPEADEVVAPELPSIEEAAESSAESPRTDIAAPAPATDPQPIAASSLPLTDGQRATAESFGIDLDSLVITTAMQICAETKLGAERYREMLGGDTPSLSESLSLLTCLRQ